MSSPYNAGAFSIVNVTTLQKRMREALARAGLNANELANLSGVHRATVSLWVNGPTKTIEGDNLVKAASVLGVDPGWLAGESTAMMARESGAPYHTGDEGRLLARFRALDKRDRAVVLLVLDSLASTRGKE